MPWQDDQTTLFVSQGFPQVNIMRLLAGPRELPLKGEPSRLQAFQILDTALDVEVAALLRWYLLI